MKIKSFFPLFFVLCLLLPVAPLFAQGDPGDDPDVPIPFDGGISLLVAAGIGYGAKKAYDARKKKEGGAAAADENVI